MSNDTLLARVNKALGKQMDFMPLMTTIEDLLNLVERQQKELGEWVMENSSMAEKHAEKDIMINMLMDQNKQYRRRIFELKDKTGWKVYEENLRLVAEVEQLKNQLNCAGEFIIRKPEYMDLDD